MKGEPELTFKAVAAGVVLALVFGAANAHLGMQAGLTVAATIPAAVLGLALFRLPFYRGGVLEQNIMRTGASVGEALVGILLAVRFVGGLPSVTRVLTVMVPRQRQRT